MSIRKVLFVFILILSSCSSIVQIEENPIEIYLAYEESLKGTDVNIPISYFHEDAVFTSDYLKENGVSVEYTELTTSEDFKTKVQEWMDDPNLKDPVILDIYSEGDTVYFMIEFNSPDGWSGAQDGYAVMKEGKIYRLHYGLLKLYEPSE